jgi:hypothetical protein
MAVDGCIGRAQNGWVSGFGRTNRKGQTMNRDSRSRSSMPAAD